ncbi:MAG TPA: hypothetical protein VHD34_10265 [Xanthobacteraceae bacterium]|nr:hypothetical protein [Xanthobacteraceae bacterium]
MDSTRAIPSRKRAAKEDPVAKRFANTTGSAEFDTALDIYATPSRFIDAPTTGCCQKHSGAARRRGKNVCKHRAAFFVSARDEKLDRGERAQTAERLALFWQKKSRRKAALKLFHREASKRVDRSHSRPKAGQADNGRETLIHG